MSIRRGLDEEMILKLFDNIKHVYYNIKDMPEFRIGKFYLSLGTKQVDASTVSTPKWHAWQKRNEATWTMAQSDENAYAVRKPCSYNCGWWTMAVSDKKYPDIANASITVDYARHLYHDCPNVPPDEKAKLSRGPLPSH